MGRPMQGDWSKLKRIGRYLVGKPRLVSKFGWQAPVSVVTTYTDSDWAGCTKTGRSTSGGIVTIGSHVIKTYSKQQRTIALSSAEAELHALVAASAETIGIVALLKDMGCVATGDVYSDSSAALGIAQRQGMGKLRHVRTQALWVQDVRIEGRLSYKKVLGSRNPADALTKYMPSTLMNQHLATINLEARGGRAEAAPTIDSVESHTEVWKYKRVRFHGMIKVVSIPSIGEGKPIDRSKKTQWRAGGGDRTTMTTTMTTTTRTMPRSTSSGQAAQGEIAGNSDRDVKRRWVSEFDLQVSSNSGISKSKYVAVSQRR